jgi:hypothetical protein
MHPEVAIQEYSFYIELPQNTHEVYMTAVENFRNYKVLLSFGGSAGIEEKLAECRKARKSHRSSLWLYRSFGLEYSERCFPHHSRSEGKSLHDSFKFHA